MTASIAPLQLTVSGSTVVSRDQDGTTEAQVNVGEVAVLYDDVAVTAAGEFASAEPGIWDVAVTYALSGEMAGNYLAPADETLQGEIIKIESPSLVVTTLDDVVDRYDEQTSLREALTYAETFDTPVAVTFADGLTGTVALAGGALAVNSAAHITVDGDGRVAIDAGGKTRAFEINSGAVTLANLTLTGGYAEKFVGAVYSAGDLTLGGVTVTDSYSGKFGGAVYIAENTSLKVTDSSFTGNSSASHGGAIMIEKGAAAEISGSYFTGNSNGSYGAAVYIWDGAVVDIANSVFVANSAPSGTIRNHGATLNLINAVISANEQGISALGGTVAGTNVTVSSSSLSAIRGEEQADFTFYNSILIGGYTTLNLDASSTIGGDYNLSTVEFGTHFIMYDGGDLFAADGYTLWGDNQAMSAASPAYNETESDAVGNHRYYGGTLDLGGVEQLAYAYGTTVEFNGQQQSLTGFYGPVAWARYSEDGENWTEELTYRNAGTYTYWVEVGTGYEGEEQLYQVTGIITPLQLTAVGTTVADKPFDGLTYADVTIGEVGVLYDDVAVTASGEFASSEIGVWDVTVAYALSGEMAANYSAPVTETLTAEIYHPESRSLVVTTLEDIVDPDDDFNSLREAIAYASTFDEAVTVTFTKGLEGTAQVAEALVLDAENAITIDGDNRITVSADGQTRVFEINSGEVTLANISIENGFHAKQGGAIYNAGDLTLDNVTVSDSYSGKFGGAVYTDENTSLTIIDSSFIDNASRSHGGAVMVEKGATADISGSYFSGNSNASYGAAVYIWNDAIVNVANTVFFNNTAPNGTLRNYGGTLSMINVVIAGNDQGFSSSAGGTNTAVNVTVTGNHRSAVRGEEGATFVFYNSILMNDNDPEITEQVGPVDMRTGATITGDCNLSTVAFGTNFIMYDGGDLFTNDGYTLWGDNQAMNAGSSAYNDTEFDAVGTDRYYGGAIDLGGVEQICYAYGVTVEFDGESHSPVEFYGPVTWTKYSLDGQSWTDTLELRNAGVYQIWVECGTDIEGEEELYLVTAEITPLQLTVSGSSVVDRDYDGTADAQVIVGDVATLFDDVTVTATGVFASADEGTWDVAVTYTVEGDLAGNYVAPADETLRGTIYKPEALSLVVTTLEDVVDRFDELTSLREAVLYAETFDTAVTVTFAEGLEGTVILADGAVGVDSGENITIDGDNRITVSAAGESRVFEINSGAVTLAGLTLTDGYAEKFGGAVYVASEGNLTVIDSTFTDNTAQSHGGAIFVDKGAVASISGSYFSVNNADAYGGAVYVWNDAAVDIANSVFVENVAPNGTIRNHGGELLLINVVISGNEQGISAADGGTVKATNVTISDNKRTAVRGEEGASFLFYNSIIIGGYTVIDLSDDSMIGGSTNLSTKAFGNDFITYDGGDLFATDGYTLWGNNQAMSAGNPVYNVTEFDAVGNSRYYGGALDLGAVEQIAYAYGTNVVFNGENQAPAGFYGPVAWAQYSVDGAGAFNLSMY